ncbi:MAG TPA: methyltransferase domain-containing protein [Parasulfuritortus sp.]
MNRQSCRVCGRPLPGSPLLHFENMPRAAQFLPDAQSLKQDVGIDLPVFQCPACGLVQIGGEPVPYYREVVRAAAFSEEMKAFRRDQFARFIEVHGLRGKRLVEIGCGRGEYLELFAEAGVDAHGLEYGEGAVEYCTGRGLQVARGFVDQPGYVLEDGPFDAFAVLNFLEHWPDPNAGLSGIAHNLREGGIGLVEVPNFDMILSLNLFTEFISDHICYFTQETLETLLRLNGFEVIECSAVWYGYILSAVVRKRSGCDVSAFDTTRRRLKTEIDGFIREQGSGGVAIWGAGHQALATIALLGLAGEIRYVVDSAPFKQGRYTPASHIPIVPPQRLQSEPVAGVIVMAASYSDEVAAIIRRDWGGSMQVAILRDSGLERV